MTPTIEPKWIAQARSVHNILCKGAKLNEYEQLIWEGKLIDVYKDVGISTGYQPRVWALLKAYEVVRVVQRGNRYQSTIIELTGELDRGELLPPEHLTAARHAATMVAEVERRVQSLTAWRESLEKGGLDVAKVLQDFERRLSVLEAQATQNGS